ncbi:putative sensor with HAMP domain protein [Hyella patelloides LEGE 07179]|uniref:Putative sensor with HAMP domain protein n=1 Tax=Hyella patelloides LEGE 07179 TaxID=945734 RepID=A0A563W027_9CYAN|nr:DUF3365 domain-containing protein [Hyella patelloides]VEP16977.1 putative sensor with HAMP domain protein [Hyella patelloides LEGE 07179]
MLTLKNSKLGTKLNIILGLALLITLIICGLSLSQILEKKVKQEVNNKAFIIIETMNSVRKYTNDQIKPELASILENSTSFLPETVPSYAAKEVFEELRKQPDYQQFTYKEATLNTTNPRDKADPFETELVTQFRQNQNLQEMTGFRNDLNNMSYYIARPLAIKDASCLSCHSTPERAPKNLIATYGSENGFGWKLNEIVGTQIISVPANEVINTAKNIKLSIIGVVFTLFIASILGINLFLKKSIIDPIKNMAVLANKISTSDLQSKFEHNSNDEIGHLASSLNRMILSLQMAIDMINSQDDC